MKNLFAFMFAAMAFVACENKASEKTTETPEAVTATTPSQEIEVLKASLEVSIIPDSLPINESAVLRADFNGDEQEDLAALIMEGEQIKGVYIVHNDSAKTTFFFDKNSPIQEFEDLNWVSSFTILEAGNTLPEAIADSIAVASTEVIADSLVVTETAISTDSVEDKSLQTAAIKLSASEEVQGGGVLFWDGEGYQWEAIK
ncbi:hypothetical protein [Persicobacter sp. CCB-QB2]|uniref:hypothetical protein n=1 Tax=Persicobacter sp. CCB-QB2 TaxID=1561025 RepID=UPI0006A9F5EA|nr:hypothetical protein [Persicobacter sp. CCB-QB2]